MIPKVWNGSAFVPTRLNAMRIWDGSSWVYARTKIWDATNGIWMTKYQAPSLDTQILTSGSTSGGDKYTYYYTYGFMSGGVLGSLSDATSNIYSGAAINKIYYTEGYNGSSNYYNVVLEIAETQSNSGWTTMTTPGGQSYNRASASFSTAGGVSTWTWTLGSSEASSLATSGSIIFT